MKNDFLSFRLNDSFVEQYSGIKPKWGFPVGAGNTLGEITFYSKYSRQKEDGSKERWHECCRRVVEGMYSLLKDHCKQNHTYWNETKAQRSAEEAYDRMFNFKWLPPGRGLQYMGTEVVNRERIIAFLYSCAFLGTDKISSRSEYEATLPFTRLMDMSIHGVGVGFDVLGAGKLTLHEPVFDQKEIHVIGDSREGWWQSIKVLLTSYFFKNRPLIEFDYSEIRPAGSVIKRVGGKAPGPGPLRRAHENIRQVLGGREGEIITSLDILDLQNIIGKCVVSGGIRRSAELALGSAEDGLFLNAKNWEVYPERNGKNGWSHLSNNSVTWSDETDVPSVVERIIANGEPGLINLDLARQYGRLVDPPSDRDSKVQGTNPCSEIFLESHELCNISESFPLNHDSLEDFLRTCKFSYLYCKAITLVPTPWQETNEVLTRNRRIGTSMSGLAEFVEERGWATLREWSDQGYKEIEKWDKYYSEWLGVRESIKMTSIKPSGTVSILAGATPGVHWPKMSERFIRRQRFSITEPYVEHFRVAGYKIEPDFMDPEFSVVVEFPVKGQNMRDEAQVSVWEKAAIAVLMQRYWADNSVSVTLTFRPEETSELEPLIRCNQDNLKAVSFLPMDTTAYRQAPYESTDLETWTNMRKDVKELDWDSLYSKGPDFEMEVGCTNDGCII